MLFYFLIVYLLLSSTFLPIYNFDLNKFLYTIFAILNYRASFITKFSLISLFFFINLLITNNFKLK